MADSHSVSGEARAPIRSLDGQDLKRLTKAALANKREHTIDTGVDVIKDDDGTTTLRTLTPSESNGVVTVTPNLSR